MHLLDVWYLRIGQALHERGIEMHDRRIAEEIAEQAGLGANIVEEALLDPTTSDDVIRDHDRAVADYAAFGVPTVVFGDGNALFGPVVAPAPLGGDALGLFRLLLEWSRFPHLYEIKRPKTSRDMARLASVFSPYLRALDWKSVEKAVPEMLRPQT